jgi:hypothetical protein
MFPAFRITNVVNAEQVYFSALGKRFQANFIISASK